MINCAFVVQSSTRNTWPLSPTRLGIWTPDLGLPNEYNLGHSDLSAASWHKLASTSRYYSPLTATWQNSTRLNSLFVTNYIKKQKNVDLRLSSKFRPLLWHYIRVPPSHILTAQPIFRKRREIVLSARFIGDATCLKYYVTSHKSYNYETILKRQVVAGIILQQKYKDFT